VATAGQAAQTTGQSLATAPGSAASETAANETVIPAAGATGMGGLSSQVWFGISVALFITWVATVAAWYVTSRRRALHPITARVAEHHQQSAKEILKQVKSACDANDPQQVKNALLVWGRQQWPQHPPTSLGHIAQRVNGALVADLHQLNDLLYKPGGAPWNSSGLWQSLKLYLEKNDQQARKPASGMPPLYRIALVNDDQ
jgi:hypothetical protein